MYNLNQEIIVQLGKKTDDAIIGRIKEVDNSTSFIRYRVEFADNIENWYPETRLREIIDE